MNIKKDIYLKTFLLSVYFFAFIGTLNAQLIFPKDIVKAEIHVDQNGTDATVIAKVNVAKDWHINATKLPPGTFGIATELNLEPSKNFKRVGSVIEPKPIEKYDELAGEQLAYHEGNFTIKQKITILSSSDFTLKGSFYFQPCDSVKCLKDDSYEFALKIKGVQQADTSKQVSEQIQAENIEKQELPLIHTPKKASGESSSNEANQAKEKNLVDHYSNWMIFWLAFGSGLLALLTPCVFPMIPMTVSFFTKTSKTKMQGIRNASFYGFSIVGIYVILGVVVMLTQSASALNEMSTNPWFNLAFFVLLLVFAVSFMGAFELRLPSSWINKADKQADRGGFIGIFFMALVLALVSFSCTGPIVGFLLVEAASEGGIAPLIGMLGFGLALALPFTLFAAFPGWLNSMPQSGGWLNTVKVVLGFLELAFAFKFLSNADLTWQMHWLEREAFIAIWIAVFGALTIYLFGKMKLPHDSKMEHLSVGRAVLGMVSLAFVIYLIPGMWGAPLKLISAFPPPMHYSESPLGVGKMNAESSQVQIPMGAHLGPQNIYVFHDLDQAEKYAKEVGKPIFIDFTGHNCVNCRKMEQSVWGESGILEILKNEVVIASLYVDERTPLPKEEQIEVVYPMNGQKVKLKTVGDKWSAKQIIEYGVTSQPYYRMKNTDGTHLENGSASYETHRDPKKFYEWLQTGLDLYKN